MYNIQFFSASKRQWLFYSWVAFSGNLDNFISNIFEPYVNTRPHTKLRIIDLNTGAIVYT
ncbi:histone H3-like centromeric protein [Pseudanabaena phage Pam2]|nr:histone H3-like centromeric protein [Pseudanabaena phage Pam2]